MKNKFYVFIGIILIALVAVGIYLAGDLNNKTANIFWRNGLKSLPKEVNAEGDYLIDIKQGDGWFKTIRSTTVHVPEGYDEKQAHPLVIMLHGGGGTAFQAYRDTGFPAKADEEGFVVAFPEGKNWVPRLWNAGDCCGRAVEDNVDDVGFIAELIEEIKKTTNIDPNRIYITGFSNGSMMAYRMACEMPGTFAAVAGVSGTLAYPECNPSEPISVLHMHSKQDASVNYYGGCGNEDKDCGSNFQHISVADNMAFWSKANGCNEDPSVIPAINQDTSNLFGNSDIPYGEIATYSGCDNSVQVELVSLDGGGHTWHEEWRAGVNATDYVWDFFKDIRRSSKSAATSR